jgi:hypothetical protein
MNAAAVRGARAGSGDDPRRAAWRASGASESESDELVAYAASPLHAAPVPAHRYPLPDAPCVAAWEQYVAAAHELGAEAVLRRIFIQLGFPIRSGMSAEPAYRAATRRGIHSAEDEPGVVFMDPGGLDVFLHPTPAGRVPVVLASSRHDFEQLVQAIVRRNEPDPVPPSMGACTVTGYNNWDRVAELRREFAGEHAEDVAGEAWARALEQLAPRTDLYQDSFLLLSSGPYSSVPGETVGLTEAEWRAASVRLRLEHECTHYFTRQAFGAMRKSLLDELIADYMGMVEALGRFEARVFLSFMGLEDHPRYREGGRLQNYRGTPPLCDGAFAVLSSAGVRAAAALEEFDRRRARRLGVADKAELITALLRVGLEGLASAAAPVLLAEAHASARQSSSLPPRRP